MMEVLFSLLGLAIIFSPLFFAIKALRRTKKIDLLEQEVENLKREIQLMKEGRQVPEDDVSHVKSEVAIPDNAGHYETEPAELIRAAEADKTEDFKMPQEQVIENQFDKETAMAQKSVQPAAETVVAAINVPPGSSGRKAGRKRRSWNQERAFAFLGAFLGIIGLVFLTLYLGSIIGIFFRFMIMTGFSALLLFISFPLAKREKWVELSHISRSFSGALFLFAVFASSTIEGLKWIDSPLLALAVISSGTLYNLILGGFCKKKGYMVFHMAINFLVIFLLPAEPLVFWLAFLLTLGLQAFGFVREERLNAGMSLLLFTAYCVFYKLTSGDFLYFSWLFNLAALISFANRIKKKDILSYIIPVLWILSAAYLGESRIDASVPLLVGVLAGALIRMGTSMDLKKLLYWPLQFLIAGSLLILATGTGTQYWLALFYVESCFFSYWMIERKEYQSLSLLFNYLILLGAVLFLYLSPKIEFQYPSMANRLLLTVAASSFMVKVSRRDDKKSQDYFTLLSIFQIMLAVFIALMAFPRDEDINLIQILLYTILAVGLIIPAREDALKLRCYSLWAVTLYPLARLVLLFNSDPANPTLFMILRIGPLLALTLFSMIFLWRRHLSLPVDWGIYLFSAILLVLIYFPFVEISSLLPSVLALALSFAYYLIAERWDKEEIRYSGFIFLFLFFFRHISHNLQLDVSSGGISIRLLMDLSALFVLYLYMKSSMEKKSMVFLQRAVFAIGWLFVLLLLFSHANRNLLSMSFQLSAFLLLFLDRRGVLKGYPLVSAAYVHYLFAQINLSVNTHPAFPFLPGILQNSWFFGFINLGTSVLLIFYFYRQIQQGIPYSSAAFKGLNKITALVMKKRNLTLLIPLFASLGLFFNWTLEMTALTIALFIGCFLLYGTALILKENVFRHATSLALLGTSVRLIFWDLAQSTMLAKSIAFMGASAIFIVINILYSQFKGRFENE